MTGATRSRIPQGGGRVGRPYAALATRGRWWVTGRGARRRGAPGPQRSEDRTHRSAAGVSAYRPEACSAGSSTTSSLHVKSVTPDASSWISLCAAPAVRARGARAKTTLMPGRPRIPCVAAASLTALTCTRNRETESATRTVEVIRAGPPKAGRT